MLNQQSLHLYVGSQLCAIFLNPIYQCIDYVLRIVTHRIDAFSTLQDSFDTQLIEEFYQLVGEEACKGRAQKPAIGTEVFNEFFERGHIG